MAEGFRMQTSLFMHFLADRLSWFDRREGQDTHIVRGRKGMGVGITDTHLIRWKELPRYQTSNALDSKTEAQTLIAPSIANIASHDDPDLIPLIVSPPRTDPLVYRSDLVGSESDALFFELCAEKYVSVYASPMM